MDAAMQGVTRKLFSSHIKDKTTKYITYKCLKTGAEKQDFKYLIFSKNEAATAITFVAFDKRKYSVKDPDFLNHYEKQVETKLPENIQCSYFCFKTFKLVYLFMLRKNVE
jgi:hypothetical protein